MLKEAIHIYNQIDFFSFGMAKKSINTWSWITTAKRINQIPFAGILLFTME